MVRLNEKLSTDVYNLEVIHFYHHFYKSTTKHNLLRSPPALWLRGYGGNCPPFCQDGARDFFKIDEKIVGGGNSNSSKQSCKMIDQHKY